MPSSTRRPERAANLRIEAVYFSDYDFEKPMFAFFATRDIRMSLFCIPAYFSSGVLLLSRNISTFPSAPSILTLRLLALGTSSLSPTFPSNSRRHRTLLVLQRHRRRR
jgi:hypothetical protein